MGKKIENINNLLAQVEAKDDEIRMVLGVKELDADLRDVGIGGANYDYNI